MPGVYDGKPLGKAGRKAYRRSVTFLMQRAVHNLAKDDGKQVTLPVYLNAIYGFFHIFSLLTICLQTRSPARRLETFLY